MRIFAPGFVLGVCVIFLLRTLPHFVWLSIFLILSLVLYIYFKKIICIFLLAFLCGATWTVFYVQHFLAKPIPIAMEGKIIKVTGFVSAVSIVERNYCGFIFKDKNLGVLKLAWYNGCPNLSPGQEWQLFVKLKRPRGLSNPGTFDFEAWALEQGISATGYVVEKNANKLLKTSLYNNFINQIRHRLFIEQNKFLPSIKGANFIPALTIGDRQCITQDEWQVLQKTGTNHLVAIAGLHIGLIAGLMFFIIKLIWRQSSKLILFLPAQQAAAIGALMMAIIYAALAGFALPTQRALIMLLVLFAGIIFKKYIVLWHSYCMALFLVVFYDPAVVLSMSFWMSFVAVGVIIFAITGNLKAEGKYKKLFKMQIAISLGMIPCTILFFQQASIISPLVNTLVIPPVGFIVIPLALIGCAFLYVNHWLAAKFLFLSAYSMQCIWWFMSQMAKLPFSAFNWAVPNALILFFLCLGLMLLIFPRGFPIKYLCIFFFLPIIFLKRHVPPNAAINFTMLDVGQGLATVIQTKHHALIFDTGPATLDGFDAGRDVVLPFLRIKEIKQIDIMIISHGDNDHAGGAKAIVENFPVKKILSSVPENFPTAWHTQHCWDGQQWQWDGVQFFMLSPNKTMSNFSKNNHSCVLKITTGQRSILLTGDIEKNAENELLTQYSKQLKADILQVPHHGSKTSSTKEFVQAVHPQYALFSTGYRNRFHFPAQAVIARYKVYQTVLYDTAITGAITFFIMPNQLIAAPILYRMQQNKWWKS